MKKERLESDSIGTRSIPADAYYGVQTLRGAENFSISGEKLHPQMIWALATVKKACALMNEKAGVLDKEKAQAIVDACEKIQAGEFRDQFLVDPIQGSAGTSINMNANEVIANVAIELLGGEKGDYSIVHPNDHVNFGQSTNDIIPSCGKLATLKLLEGLEASLEQLIAAFRAKAEEFDGVLKMGRTQMQDAVPVRLGQEFGAYATATERGLNRIRHAKKEMYTLNMGGTAIGTGINADENYFHGIVPMISEVTGMEFTQAEDLIDGTQHIDSFAAVSSAIRNCALALSKICNDLRLMSSGPRTGFGEIELPARQNGSSIMPGKVNPVIPEVVTQVAFRIAGNDTTIAMAVEGGQLELNAFEPITFYSLFQSIDLLRTAIDTFIVHCVEGIRANEERCKTLMDSSVAMSTALCPHIGYAASARLAKESLKTGVPLRQLVLNEGLMSERDLDTVLDPFGVTKPGISGKELLNK